MVSKAFGAGVVLSQLFIAAFHVQPQSCERIFLGLAAKAPRRNTQSSRGELGGETSPWGAERVFLRDPSISSTSPLASQ